MFRNVFGSNLVRDFSKFRIVKNLIVISLSFMFLFSGDEALVLLQTTMNKEKGVGTASLAINFITYGLGSLLFSSFLVQKLGTKNSQLLGIIMILPFTVYNLYPAWITMLPSAVLRGFGNSFLWAAQCTYFNESSVLFCSIEKNERKCTDVTLNHKNSKVDKETIAVTSGEQTVEQTSAFNQLSETGISVVSNRSSTVDHGVVSTVRLTAYFCNKYALSENESFSQEKSSETAEDTKGHNLKIFNDVNFSNDRKGKIFLDSSLESIKESDENTTSQSYTDSTKSLFFSIHGLAYQSASVFSSLISYYVLKTDGKENYNNTSTRFCGASFCGIHEEEFNKNIEKVPNETRYLLIGICSALGLVAPLLIFLFLDRMDKTKKSVKLSWNHVFATIKYMKKKDQLLLIPFTRGANLCRGFYVADFTKSYIACAWSISHIGLITVIFGVTSALSSIGSGVMIKYVGRRSVLVLCQLITIANFVFLLFWSPDAQHSYLFYIQGGIFGMVSGIFASQTRAFYGILFEGDEETAFSCCNLCGAIGWALPFIYGDFFCSSVKIYIVLAIFGAGFLGYLLAERSYSLRNKKTTSFK